MPTYRVPLSALFGDRPLLGTDLHNYPEVTRMPNVVRAKMFVQEVAKTTWGGRVKLQVVSQGAENKEWASATPSGSLELTIRNDHALTQFEPGVEVYVDIIPIEPAGA